MGRAAASHQAGIQRDLPTFPGETANLMMFGRELRFPNQLQGYPPPMEVEHTHEYVNQIKERLELVYAELRQMQLHTRQEDREVCPWGDDVDGKQVLKEE